MKNWSKALIATLAFASAASTGFGFDELEEEAPASANARTQEERQAEDLYRLLQRDARSHSRSERNVGSTISRDSDPWPCRIVYHPSTLNRAEFGPIFYGASTFSPVERRFRVELAVGDETSAWLAELKPNRRLEFILQLIDGSLARAASDPHGVWTRPEASVRMGRIAELAGKIIFERPILPRWARAAGDAMNHILSDEGMHSKAGVQYDFALCERPPATS